MDMNEISGTIIDKAMIVHTALGPGLLEQPYQVCLKHELLKQGMKVVSEVAMPVIYDGVAIELGYRLDLLVEDTVIVELKSAHSIVPIYSTQLLTYLRLSNKPLGLLSNFGARHLKDGIVRLINSPSAKLSETQRNLCD